MRYFSRTFHRLFPELLHNQDWLGDGSSSRNASRLRVEQWSAVIGAAIVADEKEIDTARSKVSRFSPHNAS